MPDQGWGFDQVVDGTPLTSTFSISIQRLCSNSIADF